MQKVVLLMGFPASGKSSIAQDFIDQGFLHLNRDKLGHKARVRDLLVPFEQALLAGQSVILDNLYATLEGRRIFIDMAKAHGVEIECLWMGTSIEDAQINALCRMWDRYGTIFMDAEAIKAHPQAKNDSNMFPPVVLFAFRKKLEKPTTDEGFASVKKVPFKRRPWPGTGKAIILDYDGTLRENPQDAGTGQFKYPVRVEEVKILPGRDQMLKAAQAAGFKLLGVSNQSGVAKGHLTAAMADACFEETNRQLGVDIEFHYCPHGSFGGGCYCRKPQTGFGMMLVHRHSLNPSECLFVGDMTSDRTFARRCGFQFQWAHEAFK